MEKYASVAFHFDPSTPNPVTAHDQVRGTVCVRVKKNTKATRIRVALEGISKTVWLSQIIVMSLTGQQKSTLSTMKSTISFPSRPKVPSHCQNPSHTTSPFDFTFPPEPQGLHLSMVKYVLTSFAPYERPVLDTGLKWPSSFSYFGKNTEQDVRWSILCC